MGICKVNEIILKLEPERNLLKTRDHGTTWMVTGPSNSKSKIRLIKIYRLFPTFVSCVLSSMIGIIGQ